MLGTWQLYCPATRPSAHPRPRLTNSFDSRHIWVIMRGRRFNHPRSIVTSLCGERGGDTGNLATRRHRRMSPARIHIASMGYRMHRASPRREVFRQHNLEALQPAIQPGLQLSGEGAACARCTGIVAISLPMAAASLHLPKVLYSQQVS